MKNQVLAFLLRLSLPALAMDKAAGNPPVADISLLELQGKKAIVIENQKDLARENLILSLELQEDANKLHRQLLHLQSQPEATTKFRCECWSTIREVAKLELINEFNRHQLYAMYQVDQRNIELLIDTESGLRVFELLVENTSNINQECARTTLSQLGRVFHNLQATPDATAEFVLRCWQDSHRTDTLLARIRR